MSEDANKKAFEEFVQNNPALKGAFDNLADVMAKLKKPEPQEPQETTPPIIEPVDTTAAQAKTVVDETPTVPTEAVTSGEPQLKPTPPTTETPVTQQPPTEQAAVETSPTSEEDKPDDAAQT